VHVLHSDPFFTIEFYAFHVASLVIVLSWLYRHVRRELRRKDERNHRGITDSHAHGRPGGPRSSGLRIAVPL
jgi:hypothetical protein